MQVCAAYDHYVWSCRERQQTKENQERQQANDNGQGTYVLGSGHLKITSIETLDKNNQSKSVFIQGEPFKIRIYWTGSTEVEVTPVIRIDNSLGESSTGWRGSEVNYVFQGLNGIGYFELDAGVTIFGRGDYYVSAGIVKNVFTQTEEDILTYCHRTLKFSVKRPSLLELAYQFEIPGNWSIVYK